MTEPIYKSPRGLAEEIGRIYGGNSSDTLATANGANVIAGSYIALLHRIESCAQDWLDSGNPPSRVHKYAIDQMREELNKEAEPK